MGFALISVDKVDYGIERTLADRFVQNHGRMKTMATSSHGNTSIAADRLHFTQEELERRLVQLERLAAVGELSSTTTHEFNNLLMTIINYAKLGMRHKDDASRDKAFARILDAANRGAKITSTVLGLSRANTGPLEPLDLGALVEETLVLLERELTKYRIDVQRDLHPTPKILGSVGPLQRLLLNLITNARQAIGERGTISIRVAHEKSSVVLSIRDSGCGIPREHLPKLFQPFFTTKSGPDASGKGGTGLGLSVCKEIVDEHRGRIRVDSTVGKGTVFIIRFPAQVKSGTASESH
jgi:two-component system NtrC family sensor kinase